MAYPTGTWELLGLWSGWLFMLVIYSYVLYKENPVYRFGEHTYIAIMLAVNLLVNFRNVVQICIEPLMGGDISMIVPLVLGIMIFALLIPEYRWVSRYPVALLVGAGFGLGIRGTIGPNIIDATIDTITAPVGGGLMDWVNFIYIAVGVITASMYFLLTFEHTGALKQPTRIGRLFIMIGLGAYFGNTVLFRLTMLTSRAQLFLQVLKIIPM